LGGVDKERKKKFGVSKPDMFRNKTRYIIDSGIIGTKAFVSRHYQTFKYMFQVKREKVPKAIKGPDGVCSLKRLFVVE
jgi:hypothetical protein